MVLALYLDILFQLQKFYFASFSRILSAKGDTGFTEELKNIEIFKYVFSVIRLSRACV